jgi:hypothetical protein
MTKKRNSPRRRKARPLLIVGAGIGALLSGCKTAPGPFGNLIAPPPRDLAVSDQGSFGNLIAPPPRDMAVTDQGPFGNLMGPPQNDMSVKPDGGPPEDMSGGGGK